jgi:hypothetical protein
VEGQRRAFEAIDDQRPAFEEAKGRLSQFGEHIRLFPPPNVPEPCPAPSPAEPASTNQNDSEAKDNIDRILSEAEANVERQKEAERQERAERKRWERIRRAFAKVRDCVPEELWQELGRKPSSDEFYDRWAGHMVELMRILTDEGLADRLDELAPGPREKQAAIEVFRRARTGDRAGTATLLERIGAIGGAFSTAVGEWLRRDLEREILNYQTLASVVGGVCWPALMANEPNPLAVLREACTVACNALDHPERYRRLGGQPLPRLVICQLRILAGEVAQRIGHAAPQLPDTVLDVELARRAIALALTWCNEVEGLPADPIEVMTEAIRHERTVLQFCGNGQSSFDWQVGVNRLWQLWRDLFPLDPPPPRPNDCRSYHDASDAVDALLHALLALQSRWQQSSVLPLDDSPAFEEPSSPSASDDRAIGEDQAAGLLDTREVPLEAPPGTPSPLREAYEAVAHALFDASGMRCHPPTSRLMFEDLAYRLDAAFRTARDRHATAELLLQAVAGDEGECSHQEALNAICRVNDAVGHVMLNIVPFDQATAHLQAVPAFDLAELLRSMRRQTSRAALQVHQHPDRHVVVFDQGRGVDSAEGSAQLPLSNESNDRLPPQGVEVQTPEPLLDPGPEIDQEAQAIALLFKHKDWSVARIADYLKVGRQTPYKWKKFREAAELAGRLRPRGAKDRNPRRGHKTSDGQVEAYADEDEDG